MTFDLFFFIMALTTFGGTLLFLKSVQMSLVQLIIILSLYMAQIEAIYILVGIVQVLFSLYIFYRLKQAIDYNYVLILEKTHLVERHITKGGRAGGLKSF
jgi:uncharacterized membrane protein